MTGRGLVDAVPTAAPGAGGDRVLGLFLRALMAAGRSLGLYPVGSEIASTWVRRLHRSLGEFSQQGLCFPLRVERDPFVWTGPEMRTVDPAPKDLPVRPGEPRDPGGPTGRSRSCVMSSPRSGPPGADP
jgi:hypothetical protein